ncbi:MAG TPA: hypothetical protein DEB31_02705 [Clostridiales bacterium]|nr:hypothetical protein [Clostridiales bacterium]
MTQWALIPGPDIGDNSALDLYIPLAVVAALLLVVLAFAWRMGLIPKKSGAENYVFPKRKNRKKE